MSRDQKSVMVDSETHERLSKMAAEAGLPIGQVVTSILNMIDNRVGCAKARGEIALVPKPMNPFMSDDERANRGYSYYMLFVALHLRDIGIISEAQFESFKDEDLTHLVFIRNAEFVKKIDFE